MNEPLRLLIFLSLNLGVFCQLNYQRSPQTKLNITVTPDKLVQVPQGEKYEVWLDFHFTSPEPDRSLTYVLNSTYSDSRIGFFENGTLEVSAKEIISGKGNKSMILNVQVLGELFINFTVYEIRNLVIQKEPVLRIGNYNVTAITKSQSADAIFTYGLTVGIIINTINMGCALDLEIVKNVLKRPVGPIVGFISQFLFMPLFAFGISWVIFTNDLMRLGLFVIGICPGGVASNFWTVLFNGDVNLSITMTFVSTIAAMGMMPLWIWLLSPYYLNKYGHVRVPYGNLIISLVTLTLPLGIGLLIRRYKRNWADYITNKVVKPVSLFIMLAMTALAFYNLSHIFTLFDWSIVLSGVVLGWAGYIFGAFFAWVTRLKKPQIVAISFETALQNGSVGYVVLKLSFPQPYSDIAALPAISAMLFTSFTLFAVYGIYISYVKIKECSENRQQQKGKWNKSELPSPVSAAPLLPLTPGLPASSPFFTDVDTNASRRADENGATSPSPVYYPPSAQYTGRRMVQRQNSDAGTQTYYELK